MIKRLAGLIPVMILTCFLQVGHSQNATDALRYSTLQSLGTARNIGVGQAMAPLGADFAVLNVNPAGTGAYRSSEFVITGAVFSTTTDSELLGSDFPTTSQNNTRFAFGSFGIVFASRPRNSKLKASNFALGYTRTGDYHQEFNYAGRVVGSLTDRYVENAFGVPPNQLNAFETELAFFTGAIYDLDSNLIYESDYQLAPNERLLRREQFESRGSSSEIFVSYGANINEKLLVGLSLGVPLMNYEETQNYEEEDDASDAIPFFDDLRYEEFLSTSGSGFSAKFGITYKPVSTVSIALAYHTPSRARLTDNFNTNLRYTFTEGSDRMSFREFSPDGTFEYALRRPSVLIGGVSVLIRSREKRKRRGESTVKNYGFVTAQIQYNNYSNARYDFSVGDNGDFFEEDERLVNESIDDLLSSAIRLNFGAEYMYKKLRLRAGAILDQSPFEDDSSFNTTFTTGIGVRFNRIFLDFAYSRSRVEQGYLPYAVSSPQYNQPFVLNTITRNRFFLTFGYKWL